MFHIRVIKRQGTEWKNGPQQPYPDSWGSHTPVPWPGALPQPSPELSVCPHGALGVWLSIHTTAGPTHSLSSPFPQKHLGMLQLPSWPALLHVQGPWNKVWLVRLIEIPSCFLVPGSRQLPLFAALPNAHVPSLRVWKGLYSSFLHRGKVLKAEISNNSSTIVCLAPVFSFHGTVYSDL